MSSLSKAVKDNDALLEKIQTFKDDPLGYAYYAFPWGEGPLEGIKGPREWQVDLFQQMKTDIRRAEGKKSKIFRYARCSGHGIGKTAFFGMASDWGMSTKMDTKGIITAGTQNQLRTKIWPEINKWHQMSITSHWFVKAATSVHSADPKHALAWRLDSVPWNKSRPEAFAGLHNVKKRIMVGYDESSQIDPIIWETTLGALTDEETEIFWFVFGNGTRRSGNFRECFGKNREFWNPKQINSLDVEGTNKEYLNELIKTYGRDSYIVQTRVFGNFPPAGDAQFIPTSWVEEAKVRALSSHPDDPLLIGLDPARGGEDFFVGRARWGSDARSIKPLRLPGGDTADSMKAVIIVAEWLQRIENTYSRKIDMIFVDKIGIGGPIANRLAELDWPIHQVDVTQDATDKRFAKLGDQMWGRMRDAIQYVLCLPEDPDLEEDLTNREFSYNQLNEEMLERKKDMKARGLHSPDDGDALGLTYAVPFSTKQAGQIRGSKKGGRQLPTTWDSIE